METDIYSELLDIERRNFIFDEYYRTSVDIIIQYLKDTPTLYLWDNNFSIHVSETILNDNCRIEYHDYTLSVNRIHYHNEKSFVLVGKQCSIAVHRDERTSSPRVIWFDILRLRWLIQYTIRAMNHERLPIDEVEEQCFMSIFRNNALRRKALKDVIMMKRLVLERMLQYNRFR